MKKSKSTKKAGLFDKLQDNRFTNTGLVHGGAPGSQATNDPDYTNLGGGTDCGDQDDGSLVTVDTVPTSAEFDTPTRGGR
ncbi:MAG: hypothetical protein JST38_11555 [Bacteroidetes bacterium]|nr:hypothetical protein [Bacteroidota bacterium]